MPKVIISEKTLNQIVGGLADNLTLQDIAKKHNVTSQQIASQLAKGIKVEMEHTNNRKMAEEIALDHLSELPDYYDKLKNVER